MKKTLPYYKTLFAAVDEVTGNLPEGITALTTEQVVGSYLQVFGQRF